MSAETEREELVEGSAEYTEVVRIRREKLAKLQSEASTPSARSSMSAPITQQI